MFTRQRASIARLMRPARGALLRGARLGLDLVYPPRCLACHEELQDAPPVVDSAPIALGVMLCDGCRRLLAPAVGHWCPRCSAPAVNARQSAQFCPHCRTLNVSWKRAVGLGVYRGELGKAVVQIKHPSFESLAVALAGYLIERRGPDLESLNPDVVVPIPMHWLRRWRRGTNAPDLIAQTIASRLAIPFGGGALVRCRLTPLQAESSWQQRRRNQRRSFRVAAGYCFEGKRVLLVDDVLTSGATTQAAARVLLKAGAAEVNVAMLARAGIDER